MLLDKLSQSVPSELGTSPLFSAQFDGWQDESHQSDCLESNAETQRAGILLTAHWEEKDTGRNIWAKDS